MPRPLRVVLQQPALPLYRVPIFRALAERPGISLHVVYGSVPGLPNAEPDGFDASYHPLYTVRAGARELARWHPIAVTSAGSGAADVLVLDNSPRYLSTFPSLIRARAANKGIVLWGHGLSSRKPEVRGLGLRTLQMRWADCTVFYDAEAAAYFGGLGWDRSRLFVAPNTLDTSAAQKLQALWTAQRLADFRQAHGLAGRKLVVFISRLSAERRVDVLLRAVAAMARSDTALAIIGAGPAEAECRALAQSLGLAERVQFLGGLYREAELAPWLLSAECACLPAAVGLNIVHAMSYGLPVIASKIGSHPEIVYLQHERNGLLLPNLSVDALSRALERLLSDSALTARLGSYAQSYAATELSSERMVDGLVRAIEFAAARRGGLNPVAATR